MTDPLAIAQAVRQACIEAALEGYQHAQISGLCQEGAWECAVDAMRMIDIKLILERAAREEPLSPRPPRGPASA